MAVPNARIAEVLLSDTKLHEIEDKAQAGFWDENAGIPLDGEHYGWDLSKYDSVGISIWSLLSQDTDVSVNHPTETKHKNRVQFRGRELIALDVGHWGAYHYDREDTIKPQRDFGIIENFHVFLCRFDGKQKVAGTVDELKRCKCPHAAALVAKLEQSIEGCSLGVELVSKTVVSDRKFCKDMAADTCYLILPDLHLPECWPDMPEAKTRFGGARPNQTTIDVRKYLLKMFYYCQHQPGFLSGNPLNSTDLSRIQFHLDGLQEHWESGGPPRDWPVKIKGTTFFIPFDQFKAEKDLVDRFLQCRSAWFYRATSFFTADPQPAIDLIHLLLAVQHTQSSGGKITVVQVGDM